MSLLTCDHPLFALWSSCSCSAPRTSRCPPAAVGRRCGVTLFVKAPYRTPMLRYDDPGVVGPYANPEMSEILL